MIWACLLSMIQREAVLGLVGMELIFFVATCMVLCFGFMTKTVQKTDQCTEYRWALSGSSLFLTLHPQWEGWGVAKKLGRCTGLLTQSDRGIVHKHSNKKFGSCFPQAGTVWRRLVHHTAGGTEWVTAFPLIGIFLFLFPSLNKLS